jgi:starch-binding outer membrane protein SusE/F
MKKIHYFSLLMLGVAFLACDDRELFTISDTLVAPVLEIPSPTTLVMTEAHATDSITFNWSAANYGFDAAITYTLQMDIKGAGFSDAVDLSTTQETTAYLTYDKVNTALLSLGGIEGEAKDVVFRVVPAVAGITDTLISDSVEMTLTPYEVIIIYPHLTLPGNYTPYSGGTWDAKGSDYTRIFSLKSDNKYEGYVYMVNGGLESNSAEFKFAQGDTWDINWGDNGADGTLDASGSNIALTTGGYYKVNANITALTYSVLKITRWGVIGDATAGGWDSDQAMTYDQATNKWTITLSLTAGTFKFRANDGWDLNYGDDGADKKLDAGGANINVLEAGSYTITLDLLGPVYKYILVKN